MIEPRPPVVILVIDGQYRAFYADKLRREYRAVDDEHEAYDQDYIDCPMDEVIRTRREH